MAHVCCGQGDAMLWSRVEGWHGVQAVVLVLLPFMNPISINVILSRHAPLLQFLSLAHTQSFFDSTPSGRLLNRLTKDTEAVDNSLGGTYLSFLNCAVSVKFAAIFLPTG
jgi:ABC-type multidrug transport system fused ATPase/permease subunit